jgi:hypothetical protein
MNKSDALTHSEKQTQLFNEVNDPPLVRAADRVITLREEKRIIDEKLQVQENKLISLMKKASKLKLRHGNYLIEIRTSEAKTKLALKSIHDSDDAKMHKESIEHSSITSNENNRKN